MVAIDIKEYRHQHEEIPHTGRMNTLNSHPVYRRGVESGLSAFMAQNEGEKFLKILHRSIPPDILIVADLCPGIKADHEGALLAVLHSYNSTTVVSRGLTHDKGIQR